MNKLFTLLIFLISLSGNSQSSIDLYRYWFNENITEAVTGIPGSPQSDFSLSLTIPVSDLPNGLHAFHVRFRDDERLWSSTLSRFFYKMPVSPVTENNVKQYQYWFNNDKEGAVTATTAGGGLVQLDETISVAGMADGLHVFHIRFRDESGKWSSTLSRFFYKMPVFPVTENMMTRYQYWFNNDRENSVTGTTSNAGLIQLDEVVNVAGMTDGLHVFHIRFRDGNGKWSSTISKFFYKMPVSSIMENSVQHYQYWFNNDPEGAVTAATAGGGLVQLDKALNVTGMTDGLHVFHIRFRDGNGKWSSTISRFFYKMPVTGPIEENLVTAYRYWFNEGDGSMALVELDQAVNPLHLVADIETPYLGPGMHAMNIQFLDLNRQWSSVLTEEFEVVDCSPRYMGNPEGAAEVCGGTNESYQVDAALNITDFQWTLTPAEAGTVSENGSMAGILWSDNFNGEAVLTVQGSNPCGETDGKSISISISSAPYVTAMDDTVICEGESTTLAVLESYGSLEWDVEDILVTPQQETTYSVTAVNLCGTAEDQVVISVDTYPSLSVMEDTEICQGDQVELIASSDGTVTWSGGSDIVLPAETTNYTATAQNGVCSVEDEVSIVVKPLPILTVMEDLEICEGEELLLEAESDGIVTWSTGSELVAPSESAVFTAFAEKDGCEVQEDLVVTVNPTPETPVLEQVDEALVSSSVSGNIWFFNDSEIEGVSTQEYSPEASGEYFVRVISTEGCISEPSNLISFTVSNLIKIGMREITVYPNPVKDQLFIDPGLYYGEPFRVELLTLGGRVLMIRNITSESFINVAGLSPSVYILKIIQGEESRIMRIIKN